MQRLSSGFRHAAELVLEAYARFVRHGGDGLAAGVAFGTLLSIAPLLVVAVAVAGTFLGEGSARAEVVSLVRDALGRRGAELVGVWIDEANRWQGTATALGLGGFLFGAARLVSIVDAAFDVVFEAPRRTPFLRESVRDFFATYAIGIAVTAAAGTVIVASIALRAVSGWLDLPDGSLLGALVLAVRLAASFGLLVLALAIVYRALPPRRLHESDVLEGAVITAVLLEATTWLLSFVLERVDVGAPYGAAGAVVASLVWLLVAASLFLLGAEITAERAERRSRRLSARVPASAVSTPAALPQRP